MTTKNITDQLILMLGRHALDNGFKVSRDFGKLSKTVNYLVLQLNMLRRDVDPDNAEYIDKLQKNVLEILNPEEGE